MTYYGPKELAESFQTVRNNTIIIAEEIPEEQYAFKASPETRSVAQMLTHIALIYRFQEQLHAIERRTTLEGFDFTSLMQRLMAEEQKQRTKGEIIDLLRRNGETWAGWLRGISEEFLAEPVTMPPGATPATKSRFEMILSVKEHEMHHRGQLMLIERQLGLVPHLTRQMQERLAAMAAAKP